VSPISNSPDFWRTNEDQRAEKCWHAIHQPHRQVLVEALKKLPPFETLLEIGSNAGPNLRLIHDAFPDVDLTGLDVSGVDYDAAKFAELDRRGELAGKGRVGFVEGPIPESLRSLHPTDVVLSCYALAYVTPKDFAETMFAITEIAQRAIVLAEPMVVVGDPMGISQQIYTIRNADGQPVQFEFKHDYLGWFRTCAHEWTLYQKPLAVDRMNRFVVAQRKD